MRTRDVMQTSVVTTTSKLPIAELEEAFVRANVSGLPVVDDGELRGVVSRTDLVRALASAEGNADATLAYYEELGGGQPSPSSAIQMAGERIAKMTVKDIMTSELIVAPADGPVRDVARTMVRRGIHRVLVVEGRRLLGIVTTLDLVRMIADGRI